MTLEQCLVEGCTRVAMVDDFCEPHYNADIRQKGKELVTDWDDYWKFVVIELRRKGRNLTA